MINRSIVAGRLTKDLEKKQATSPQGYISVVSFTLACDRKQKNPDGSKQADFINCVAWRQNADFLCQYVKKGDLIGIDGKIRTSSYQKQDGSKAYITKVVADEVNLLERKQTEQGSQRHSNANQDNWNYTPDVNEDDVPF